MKSPDWLRKVRAAASLGGKARAATLPPQARQWIGRNAARIRWDRHRMREAALGYPRPALPPDNGPKEPMML